jgi:hypothetical protein
MKTSSKTFKLVIVAALNLAVWGTVWARQNDQTFGRETSIWKMKMGATPDKSDLTCGCGEESD